MTFGEKLKLLRKEKNCSQEAFAELLNVSRQAISKWESDKGIPEIDTLLQISNMFGVTLDYLLKSEQTGGSSQNNGYYVNSEMLRCFLTYKTGRAGKAASGIFLLIAANALGCFSDYRHILLPLYWTASAAGIAILIWTFFQPKRYQEICSEPLVFDEAVINSFRGDNNRKWKRYVFMIISGVLLLFAESELSFIFSTTAGSEICNAAGWLLNAVSAVLFITAGTSMQAGYMITQNAEYLKRKNSGGKFRWIYAALPVTFLAVLAGIITNAWSPVVPVIFLLCILLITLCKLILEGRNYK